MNATWQYDHSGNSKFSNMAERSDGYSGEKLLALCARKKKLQRKMTENCYWIGAEESIGKISKSENDRNSLIYLSLFERQVRPMFKQFSNPCDNWKLFCEPASDFCDKRDRQENNHYILSLLNCGWLLI